MLFKADNIWLDYIRWRVIMSSIIYVVPWAICETESMYIKKVSSDTVEAPVKGATVWDWCIRNVIPSPDKRTKDIYVVIDVFNGYKEHINEKGMSVFSLNNSAEKLVELGFDKATESEAEYIRTKVLKLNKDAKRKK